ncbi:Protein root UVB sensitive 4 [Orobanche minor]
MSMFMKVAITSSCPPSQSHLCSTSALRYNDPLKITKPNRPKTTLKPFLAFSKSSSTTSNFSHEYQEGEKIKPHLPKDKNHEILNLPVAIRHSGTVSRYFWDGKELKLVAVDGTNGFSLSDFSGNFGDGMRKLGKVCLDAVRNFFLPREISENYLEYVKWKFLHRVFSSALQVLATQAMFRAIGIGYSRSLPPAAALNWVLKDGLGRISRCIYTATLASAFDTNLKRVRFATSILFSFSIGVELLTPVFPKYFLLLATIANTAKQISLACYLATGSAVHRSFAIADNLGELSAKAQIQTVCFDNVGFLLAATFNILCRNNQRLLAALPFVVYPIFSAIDLLGIYQGMKHVHLQTLTKDRLESIIKIWIQLRYIPSPAEVSKKEGIDFLWSKDSELLPIRIGCLNPKRKMPTLSLMTLKSLKDEDSYFICVESLNSGSGQGILLCLREGAGTSDVVMGLLQACYIRNDLLLLDTFGRENVVEARSSSSDTVLREWFLLLEESKRCAQDDIGPLINNMSGLGWSCRNVLLSTREQVRYKFCG